MGRKKSGKKVVQDFKRALGRIVAFTEEVTVSGLGKQSITWAYEAALIRTYVEFERLMLDCIVTAINNDTDGTIGLRTNVSFPKHLTDEVCEYLVIKEGYFDFKGRDGLIRKIREYLPDRHWLIEVIRKQSYVGPINTLVALRNFAAHDSPRSKRAAAAAVGASRLSSAGAWIKCNQRFPLMIKELTRFADELEGRWPY
ncbi:hypothetical protein [Actinorhabdospora filicis]|nr:hypothetical protein [Actinorhabdospora filicis]